jgi:hypothetical protein
MIEILGVLKKQRLKIQQIADHQRFHLSTIYHKPQRNDSYVTDGTYRPSNAKRKARLHQSRSRPNRHGTDFDIIRKLLKKSGYQNRS